MTNREEDFPRCKWAEITKNAKGPKPYVFIGLRGSGVVRLDSRNGGEGGIRTHGTGDRTPDFESGPFDHSGTSPVVVIRNSEKLSDECQVRKVPPGMP